MKNRFLTLYFFISIFSFADLPNQVEETIAQQSDSFKFQMESAGVWQTRNTFRLPGNSGSEVRLSDYNKGPFFSLRFYLEYKMNEKNGLRLLVAPLAYDINYTPSQNLSIQGNTFNAGTPLTTKYKFNSYRLTYRYFFDPIGPWVFRLGATLKVRDANISTTDGVTTAEKPNLGFVPLLHFGVRYNFAENWFADLDADALAAPQGRAEDVALRLGYSKQSWEYALGYRMLEGGADNNTVYTFAFLHYAFLSIAYSF